MSCERRIKNEMKNWPSDWIYGKDNNCIFITLLNFIPKKIFFLKIVLGNSYPFKQPTVFCNNNDIIKFYRDTHSNPIKELQDDMKLLTGKECGCCQSFLCGDNWGPSIKIKDIIDEFHEMWIYWQRAIERFHCKKVTQKYLIEHLPIFEYL